MTHHVVKESYQNLVVKISLSLFKSLKQETIHNPLVYLNRGCSVR